MCDRNVKRSHPTNARPLPRGGSGDRDGSLVRQNALSVSSRMPVPTEFRVVPIRRTPASSARRKGENRSKAIRITSDPATKNQERKAHWVGIFFVIKSTICCAFVPGSYYLRTSKINLHQSNGYFKPAKGRVDSEERARVPFCIAQRHRVEPQGKVSSDLFNFFAATI